ncbi:MAG: glycosyltransferase family 4 protein [Chitinophagaceae bacterium]
MLKKNDLSFIGDNNKIKKPIILTFVCNYLPGFKAGGILRNVVNTIDNLHDDFDFWIVTKDRDLGDDVPYKGIKINEWQKVGNAMVLYLSPQHNTFKKISKLLTDTYYDIILLNSFFDPFTFKVLLYRKIHLKNLKPVIVAPFGEFAWASLGQKYTKKYLFIKIAKVIGLYNNVIWRVSSEFEKADLIKVMNVKSDRIHITGDIPIKNIPEIIQDETFLPDQKKQLRIVFLSRIAREKNLDYAIRVLQRVKAQVTFDIYGPAENEVYWKECQELILKLPGNVTLNYLGSVTADQVFTVFRSYDLFLFPTGGEAYGNVIAECLAVGTPVLLSTETPWKDLQSDGLGWDISLDKMDDFVAAIEYLSSLDSETRLENRNIVKKNIGKRLFDPFVLESNRQLFKMQLHD